MIIGVGTDLVELAQIKKILAGATGKRFVERVLTPQERLLADTRQVRLAEFVAGRFAAKEAVVKALGCGIGQYAGFQDINIVPDELGRPVCQLSAAAVEKLELQPSFRIHLSITHTDSMAAAYAVAEQLNS